MIELYPPVLRTRDRLRLPDGSICRIRPSGEADRQRVIDFFNALSQESRRLRFFTGKQHLSAAELDRFTGADGHDHIAYVAVSLDGWGREQEPLGFARCFRLEPSGTSAEFSVTVADRFQRHGLGSALLDRLAEAAGAVGIHHLHCEVLAENIGMRHLAEHLEGEARWLGDGIVEYSCILPDKTPQSHGCLPWYADPDGFISGLMDVWLIGLDDGLALAQTTSERLDRWLANCRTSLHGSSVTA